MLERMARPLRGVWNGAASAINAFYRVLGSPGKVFQSFMNGSWLGHSLHAVIVDVVIGAATAALLLDVLRVVFNVEGLESATVWVVGLAVLAAVGAIFTGLTDFKDTGTGDERNVTGLHGLINIVGTGGLALSLVQRLGDDHGAAFWSLLIGYLIISVGGYIGGHIVFKHGYMVNHNAFSRGRRANEFTSLMPAADLPEGVLTRATFGTTAVMLVRRGDVIHALKDTCSHAGGPLSDGALKGDTVVCPWHQSEFKLADGSVVHGPAGSRQVSYRTRINGDQVELQGPHD